MGFEEGVFDTSLTKVLKPSEGLEILSPCNSAKHTGINTGEECAYEDQLPTVWVPKIPPAPAGNADGKTARLRRVSVSTESLNDLPPVTGPNPRSVDSIPSPYLDDSHVKLLGNWFRQIIPLIMCHNTVV